MPIGKKAIFGLLIVFIISSVYPGYAEEALAAEKSNNSNKYDVIVIGAGLSGLGAAYTLHKDGYKVLVLEARNRPGGRIWTERSLGTPLDMGATWIQGKKGNPVAELTKEFGIKTTIASASLTDSRLYDQNGKWVGESVEETIEEYAHKFLTFLADAQEESEKDMPLSTVLDYFIKEEELSGIVEQGLRTLISVMIEGDYAGSLNQLSLLEFNQDSELSGDDLFVPQGLDQVPKYLAKDLKIQYNEPVSAVTYNDQGVTVQTAKGEYHADYAISSVPLGVLKKGSIRFSPPLPADKQQAIQRMGMGLLDKLYLKFPRLFWEKDKTVHFIGYASGSSLWTGFLNFYKYSQEPILLAFNPGPAALAIEQKSDTQIVSEAMSILRKIYGNDIPEPTGYLISRWGQDPYSLGAYSYMAYGSTGSDYDTLAKPVNNRLFFAGEATSRKYPALVHGAYWSGLRAAEEIKELK